MLPMETIKRNCLGCIRRWRHHDTHQMRAIEGRSAAMLCMFGLAFPSYGHNDGRFVAYESKGVGRNLEAIIRMACA